jgi:hypothetical protein
LVGFEKRVRLDAFLKEHELYGFTVADFEPDRETFRASSGLATIRVTRFNRPKLPTTRLPARVAQIGALYEWRF